MLYNPALYVAVLYIAVLYNPAGLPAVLTAVVNVVNGSFRADAASSLIVTRGFMGNLPVNFSTYSNILRATLPMHCFPSKFKLSGKWPACNAIQHNTLTSLHALHFWAIVWGESCCHSQVYNCSTSSRDFPASCALFSNVCVIHACCALLYVCMPCSVRSVWSNIHPVKLIMKHACGSHL